MIEKMKFLSITGPKDDIDRVAEQYLSRYEIHLENALSELKTVTNLRPFAETNPYKEDLKTARELVAQLQEAGGQAATAPGSTAAPGTAVSTGAPLSVRDAAQTVRDLAARLEEFSSKRAELAKKRDTLAASRSSLAPFANLNYDVSAIFRFRYVKFRFGRIPHDYYRKFMDYVYDTVDTVVHACQEDADYVWIVYFVPLSQCDKIDAIFASLHFERFFLPEECQGTPTEATQALNEKLEALDQQLLDLDLAAAEALKKQSSRLLAAYRRLDTYSTNFDVRKLAACTKKDNHTFYILCGWMTEADAAALREELKQDGDTFCLVEDNHSKLLSQPPTKLKNPGIFRPFELFIRMYGLPAYGELDPTVVLGLTYSFLFGFMFGDVGQGLCLMVGGFLLYRVKKLNLAAIISCCGFFSTLFGFLFGSIFGFENLLKPLWLRPKEAMTRLPFIGNLNTVFVVAVALGMGIILMSMVLNLINSLRSRDPEKAYFDANGAAGMVFYAALAVTVFLYMSGHVVPAGTVLAVMFGLPLAVIFLKEPLAALVKRKAQVLPESRGMFLVQGFFELFEVCLSYFSNTLSFVRVGAFAVSHAAMMEVVLMLAGAEAGSPNWVVVVLGNLFVCGMEGLIVGIQVLRLEYYELFSRFYRGTGREFKPYGRTGA